MKDHELAKLTNDLRDIAIKYGQTQQLRERIAHRLHPEIIRLRTELAAAKQECKEVRRVARFWNNAYFERYTAKELADVFLAWQLPKDFMPDCGISFDGRPQDARGYPGTWPSGTNLFTAAQAEAMFQFILDKLHQEDEDAAIKEAK